MHDYTSLINTANLLPPDYVPPDLTEPDIPFFAPKDDPRRLLRLTAAWAVHQLCMDSRFYGMNLYGISGYRSYDRQQEIYENSLKEKGTEHTEQFIALPGSSEHQSGLALDMSCPDADLDLTEDFARTSEGIWLKQHAPLYGFIIRYPKGKEEITGYAYEPWHIRYVTRPLALYLGLTGLTLDEYWEMRG